MTIIVSFGITLTTLVKEGYIDFKLRPFLKLPPSLIKHRGSGSVSNEHKTLRKDSFLKKFKCINQNLFNLYLMAQKAE